MARLKQINFGLLANAKDFLRQAVESLAWKDTGDDHSRLKHAISDVANAIELLLKEKLRQKNPALIWEKQAPQPGSHVHTVTAKTAISRLNMNGVNLLEEDCVFLESLRTTRNQIAHYEWAASEPDARDLLGHALSFAFAFGKDQLGTDLSQDFKQDDTWRVLVHDMHPFVRAYGSRIQARLNRQGKHPVCCDTCGELTVPASTGYCELCGGRQEADEHDL